MPNFAGKTAAEINVNNKIVDKINFFFRRMNII